LDGTKNLTSDAEWRDAFRRDAWEHAVPVIRMVLLCGCVLFLVFWAWDFLVDSRGARHTLPIRLSAAALYALLFGLVWTVPRFRRRPVFPYILGVVAAPAMMVLVGMHLVGGHLVVLAGVILVLIVVGMIGPYDRVVIWLTVAVIAVGGGGLVLLSLAGLDRPGVPSPKFALEIAFLEIAGGVLVILLSRLDTGRRRRLFELTLRLQQLVLTDPLTGALNRRGLAEEFEREARRQQRHGRTAAVLLLDIDHFKRVNDTRGHAVGDEVLVVLARRIQSALRDIDAGARVGGEEFVAFLPETDRDGAMAAAERLRTSIAATPFIVSGGPVDITVSIGVCLGIPGRHDLETLLKAADEALYRAKAGGRNRCEEGVLAGAG